VHRSQRATNKQNTLFACHESERLGLDASTVRIRLPPRTSRVVKIVAHIALALAELLSRQPHVAFEAKREPQLESKAGESKRRKRAVNDEDDEDMPEASPASKGSEAGGLKRKLSSNANAPAAKRAKTAAKKKTPPAASDDHGSDASADGEDDAADSSSSATLALAGKVICITGTLSAVRTVVVARVVAAGGTVANSLSKRVTHLVTGAGAKGASVAAAPSSLLVAP
jgi:NAD-dependent DNA ligase